MTHRNYSTKQRFISLLLFTLAALLISGCGSVTPNSFFKKPKKEKQTICGRCAGCCGHKFKAKHSKNPTYQSSKKYIATNKTTPSKVTKKPKTIAKNTAKNTAKNIAKKAPSTAPASKLVEAPKKTKAPTQEATTTPKQTASTTLAKNQSETNQPKKNAQQITAKVTSNSDNVEIKQGILITDKPGYVRSPYTTPAKLIDVTDYKPGQEARCPYTRRIFIVPGEVPAESIAKTETTKPAETEPTTETTPEKAEQTASTQIDTPETPEVSETKVEIETETANKKESTEDTSSIAQNTENKIDNSKEQQKEEQEVKKALPFGKPVQGLPGFVSSPYAKDNQLVNIQGLEPGVIIRCPYSGKVFRVPLAESKLDEEKDTIALLEDTIAILSLEL